MLPRIYEPWKRGGGRKAKRASVAELRMLIQEYFDDCYEEDLKKVKRVRTQEQEDWSEVILEYYEIKKVYKLIRPPTLSWLANAIWCNRKTIERYIKKQEVPKQKLSKQALSEFCRTMEEAKSIVEQFNDERLVTHYTPGIAFNLRVNFWWEDKQILDHQSMGEKITSVSFSPLPVEHASWDTTE